MLLLNEDGLCAVRAWSNTSPTPPLRALREDGQPAGDHAPPAAFERQDLSFYVTLPGLLPHAWSSEPKQGDNEVSAPGAGGNFNCYKGSPSILHRHTPAPRARARGAGAAWAHSATLALVPTTAGHPHPSSIIMDSLGTSLLDFFKHKTSIQGVLLLVCAGYQQLTHPRRAQRDPPPTGLPVPCPACSYARVAAANAPQVQDGGEGKSMFLSFTALH